jgi:hypothetical protein
VQKKELGRHSLAPRLIVQALTEKERISLLGRLRVVIAPFDCDQVANRPARITSAGLVRAERLARSSAGALRLPAKLLMEGFVWTPALPS